ncbi:MAG: type I DNA topoisomerase [Pseudomonadota bacterium]
MESKEYRVIDLFDQILAKHMGRLIGSRYGICELPLNLATIATLILLAEREKEIKNFPSSSPDRYDREILFKELSEMGLEQGVDTEKALEDLIQKGYVNVNVRYRLKAKKPTISMVELLNRAFPKLPGLNLVAYFVQTIDEVHSDRKDIKLGIVQFDQMLQEQGVPLRARRETVQQKSAINALFQPEITVTETPLPQGGDLLAVIKKGLNLSNLRSPAQNWEPEGPEEPPVENKDPYSPVQHDTAPVHSEMNDSISPEPESAASVGPGDHDPEDRPSPAPGQVPPSLLSDDRPSEVLADKEYEGAMRKSDLNGESTSEGVNGDDLERSAHTEEGVPDDDTIDDQISEFQGRLNIRCPLCDMGKIEEKETSKGKIFYHCNNEKCNFISWGQPYHIECPLCKNPFLIEKSKSPGKPILRCPRATCRYWQVMPWETEGAIPEGPHATALGPIGATELPKKTVRKVKRRRVVRRRR